MDKTTSRKIMAIILALAMVISLTPAMTLTANAAGEPTVVETADFEADAAHAIALLGGSENVGYNTDTNEIILKGVDFTTSAEVAVNLPDGVKLVLENGSENRIISTYAGEYESCGIQGINLTICGEGSLEVKSGTLSYSSRGISASSITISGGKVNATGGEAQRTAAGISASSITISGGQVTGRGGKARWNSWGIIAGGSGSSISISGSSNVTAIGGEAEESIGITASSAITISGGELTAEGGGTSYSIGVEAGSVIISGGTVTAIGGNQALSGAPMLEDYIDYTAVGADSVIGGDPVSPEPYDSGNNNEYKYFNIQPMLAGPIIYVNVVSKGSASGSSWANASTLQTALDKAKPGNQIWVAKGTYFPTSVNGIVEASVENYDRYKHFQMKNGVAIYGGFAGDEAANYDLSARDFTVNETILSGDIGTKEDNSDNSYHVFYHDSLSLDNTAELDGFTIAGGNANHSSWKHKCGSGMFNDGSSPKLTNVAFIGNSAGDEGGGIYNDGSSPTLTNVIFSGNTASCAGGMSNNYSSPTLTNVIFSKNSASRAGGMYNLSSNPILTDVTFSENSAQYNGGGMNNVGDNSPVLTNVIFSGNSAGDYGGGIYNDSGWGSDISMLLLTNVAFIGNSAGKEGGGMRNCGGSFPNMPVLTNVTFSGNSAGTEGGGMYNDDVNSPTITNSIFWGNSNGHIDGPGAADITYSLIQGYTGTGKGNISGDPMFAGVDDFSLKAGSPAIDTGTNEPFEAGGAAYGVTTDIVGNPRIANNIVDMGAYENQESIVVKAQPDKLVYTEGETLDLTGLQVVLTYDDKSTADAELADFEANGITADPANGTVMTVAAHNGQPVTLTWNSLTAATANLTVNAVTASPPSTPSTPPVPPANTGFDILVNGKAETAATATTTREGDKTVTSVVVDAKKVDERLAQEGNNAVVTIPVKNGSDVVIGTLNGQTVKNMENMEAVLEIKTENVTYTIPASQINIDAVSAQFGEQIELKDIAVSVKISEPAADTVKIVEDTSNRNNYQIVVNPVEFEITCSSGGKTVEVSKFNAYVERLIEIPEDIDPSRITTGVILNSDGTFSHVPTVITIIDGKYYAKINSLSNSVYSVIYSPKTFKDVEKHWAKDAVNDMGSRLVISGVGEDNFEPDRDITRGEFAAIVVRALGLMRPGTGKASFNDIAKNDWYYDAVSKAYENDIISGYGNGKFGPDDKITREQAMTVIARAMKITGLKVEIKDSEVSSLLSNYTDGTAASAYAKTTIAACLKTGVITGRIGSTIAPRDYITRAEVAVIVQRLLQKSNLI